MNKPCLICGKIMSAYPCLMEQKKYCSAPCRIKGVAIQITKPEKTYCQLCGKEIMGKDRLKKKYCDRKCMAKAFTVEERIKRL